MRSKVCKENIESEDEKTDINGCKMIRLYSFIDS